MSFNRSLIQTPWLSLAHSPPPMTRRIILTVNAAWNAVTFRAGLIRALQHKGYDVVVLAPADRHVERLRAMQCSFVDLPMDNQGTHAIRDFVLLCRYVIAFSRVRPAAILSFTIKPNVYSSIAARPFKIPVINNV